MKPIEEIANDAKWGDIVLLEFNARVNYHGKMHHGQDYLAGFFQGADEDFVYLDTKQKLGLLAGGRYEFEKNEIKSYEIIERYQIRDEIDVFLTMCREGENETN